MSDEDEGPFLINAAKEAHINSSVGRSNNDRLSGLNALEFPGQRKSQESNEKGDDRHDNGDSDLISHEERRSSPGTSVLRRRFRRRSTANSTVNQHANNRGSINVISGTGIETANSNNLQEVLNEPHEPSSKSNSNPSVTKQSSHNPQQHDVRPPIPIYRSSYIRKQPVNPDEQLREKFKNRLRSAADGMPEVHFIGEIVEGSGFPTRFGEDDSFVSCKWHLEWGKAWSFLQGDRASQTQYASACPFPCNGGIETTHVWNHPIDVHFASASMQGWPRLILQIWELDEYGRSILGGYGFVHLPTNPGHHELEVHCWKLTASLREELQSFFLGTSTCLADEDAIFGKAWEDRSKLVTVSAGMVSLMTFGVVPLANLYGNPDQQDDHSVSS